MSPARPVRTAMTAAERFPGAERVKGIVGGVLDSVGIVSPQARRVVAYTGAGLLGVAGVVEWPVVLAGAAVVWFTQPRPKDAAAAQAAGEARAEGMQAKAAAKSAKGSAASGTATRSTKSSAVSGTANACSSKRTATSTPYAKAGGRKKS
ncbi:hypothetical protein [Streptomyces sp. NPDC053427]|uniref:hypothetical protein n=1 Tax=Streptomyces sp. NPDC053427 TaxID=3365701 RepID=UPI0037D7A053